MVHFYRLVVALFLAAFCAQAFAVIPVITGKRWGVNQFGTYYPTKAEVCAARVAQLGPPTTGWTFGVNQSGCNYIGGGVGQTFFSQTTFQCPVGTVMSPPQATYYDGYDSPPGVHTCSCPSGWVELNNSGFCTLIGAPSGPVATQELTVCSLLNLSKNPLIHQGQLGLTACYQGMEVTGTGAARGASGGEVSLFGPFSCKPGCASVPAGGAAAPSPCKANEFTGAVNGVSVCIPSIQAPESVIAPEKEAIAPPSGAASGTAPTGSISGAPAGTVSSTTTTSCIGQACTKTTTFSDLNGIGVGTKTETVSKATFCQENKDISICQARTFTGKTCPAVNIECDGDAIACGIAQRQQITACQLEVREAEEVTFYNTEKNKPGNVTTELPGNSTVQIGSANFSTAPLMSGACITDKVIVVAGNSVTIPLSGVCAHLALLGNALLAFSFILAARIVGRG